MSLVTNLLGYWRFDGNSNDSYGTNTGTDTSMSYVTGHIGNAASFGGSSKINTGASYSTNVGSVSLWFKTSTLGTNMCMVALNDSSTGNSGTQTGIFLNSSNGVQYGGASVISTATNYRDGNWHHYVCTFNSTAGVLYIDGSQVASGTVDNLNFAFFPRIGCNGSGGGDTNFFNGQLDELMIYSRVLSSGEVTSLYNSGSGVHFFITSATAGSYTLSGQTTTLFAPTHLGPVPFSQVLLTSASGSITIGSHPRRVVVATSNVVSISAGPVYTYPTTTFNGQSITYPVAPVYLAILNQASPVQGYYIIPDNLAAGTYTITTNVTSPGTAFNVFYDVNVANVFGQNTGGALQNTTSPFDISITPAGYYSAILKAGVTQNATGLGNGAGESTLGLTYSSYKVIPSGTTTMRTTFTGGGSANLNEQLIELNYGGIFNMTASSGSYALTGKNVGLQEVGLVYPITASSGSYSYAGNATGLVYKANPWHPVNKGSASWTVQSKDSTTMTPTNKSSASFSVQSKS